MTNNINPEQTFPIGSYMSSLIWVYVYAQTYLLEYCMVQIVFKIKEPRSLLSFSLGGYFYNDMKFLFY